MYSIISFLSVFGLVLSGCGRFRYVKYNASLGQVTDTAVIRKPSGEKTLGMLPKYDEFLEGYLRGGLLNEDGKTIGGVTVKVQDVSGNDLANFTPGITDQEGVYKIRFSVPVRWGIVDFKGNVSCEQGWRIISPNTEFRLYFSERMGVLTYSINTLWLPVKNVENEVKKRSLPPVKKPAAGSLAPADNKGNKDDLFGDFDFGQ